MSSARNHAKRSHRSEHARHAAISASARRMVIKQATKPTKTPLMKKLSHLFQRKTTTN